MKRYVAFVCITILAISTFAFADFRYEEKSTITGGAMVGMMKMAGAYNKQAPQAGQPTVSTIFVKGNRMARINAQFSELIDLDKETITHIDHARRQFSVTTFQQMKQQMERMEQPDVSYDVKVRNTGATKQIAGVPTKQAILTMTMKAQDPDAGPFGAMSMTNDMWVAADVRGYAEVREFYKRFAGKMGTVFTGGAGMQPGMSKGMAEMAKELAKLEGLPIYQVMRMGTSPNGKPLPAASEAPLPKSSAPDFSAMDPQSRAMAARKMAEAMGGQGGGSGPNVMMETTVEMMNFAATSVEASRFDVPAGYAKVEADKHGR